MSAVDLNIALHNPNLPMWHEMADIIQPPYNQTETERHLSVLCAVLFLLSRPLYTEVELFMWVDFYQINKVPHNVSEMYNTCM